MTPDAGPATQPVQCLGRGAVQVGASITQGVTDRDVSTGLGRNGQHWHMARTPVTQQELNNTWVAAQGLLSVKDLWCKAQGYTQAKTSSSKPAY